MAGVSGSSVPVDDEVDEVQSLQDVIADQEELEDTANAVLGDSDDTNCSYDKGYVLRQALYSCATCTPPSGTPAGLCLACSLQCHEGHQLYEMYTKRNFRCDCGNSHFPDGFRCTYCPQKDKVNLHNQYNHNFEGVYCTCNRPYPDSEDEVEDEMLQCVVCEDWFHGRHLGAPPPFSYHEMSCDKCTQRLHFLRAYQIHRTLSDKQDTSGATNGGTNVATDVATNGAIDCDASGDVSVTADALEATPTTSCGLKKRQSLMDSSSLLGPAYLPVGWRSQLCHCSDCKELYSKEKVTFLCDEQDSVSAYEARGQPKQYTHDAGLQALTSSSSGLDRVQQVELVHEFNHMKSKLKSFLSKFAEDKKVVSERDIANFFEEMRASKRRCTDSGDGVPPGKCH